MHKITIHQEVIEFFRSYGTITNNEGNTEFKAPNWTFKHIELNDFEVIFHSKQERFFYISYNGINPEDGKTVIGHLGFSHLGMPSMLYITEVLVPQQSKAKCQDVVMLAFIEFKDQQDFDDFTIGRNMGEQMEGFKLN